MFQVKLEDLDFEWDVLELVIGGKSVIDSTSGLFGLPMKTKEDATRFVAAYGFDLEDPIQHAELLGNLHEAINFVRKHFLAPENPEGLKLEIPRKILEIQNLRELFLMASPDGPPMPRAWACVFLKVIHAIVHLDKDIRYDYFSEIQKQIFDRFYKVLQRSPDDRLFLGAPGASGLELVGFQTKPKKTRESVLLKLLHKPEILADEIFDRVGLRFVTRHVLDTLRVIQVLKRAMIFMPPNVKPSRSRNTLVDLAVLQKGLTELRRKKESREIEENEIEPALAAIIKPPGSIADNPHSSAYYRAIQFTCRQLIQLNNPLYGQIREVKQVLKNEAIPTRAQALLEAMDLGYVQRQIRFFYPYEVQIVDQANHQENEKGLSAHSQYKRSQVQTALRRVMGSVLEVGSRE